jgi:hypothetical protein
MTKSSLSALGSTVVLLSVLSAPAIAADNQNRPGAGNDRVFPYFLPRAKAVAGFSQRIVKCPSLEDDDILVETSANIVSKTAPDYARLYQFDAAPGFLSKRNTEMKLNPDGTIKSINATVEGQAGPVIVSVIKAAAFVASSGMIPLKGPPGSKAPPRKAKILYTVCKGRIAELVKRRADVAADIFALERRLADSSLTAGEADQLKLKRDELTGLDDSLTLESDPAAIDPAIDGAVFIDPLDYSEWFSKLDNGDRAKLPGNKGVVVSWKADALSLSALNQTAFAASDGYTARRALPQPPKPDPSAPKPKSVLETLCANGNPDAGDKPAPQTVAKIEDPEAALYYRKQVPVAISLESCPLGANPKAPDPLKFSASKSVSFPQLAGLFRMQVGRGRIFGSREVAVEFDETGAPISLKYASDPGAADIASVVDATTAAGTTLRDAKADALARQAAILQSRKDIRDLTAELDKQP